ncbi:MAG: sorbosone dehydrogenase, partial [Planctomycetaceae bacterium]
MWLTARELAPLWLPSLKEGVLAFKNGDHLVFALKSVGSSEVVPMLVEQVRSDRLTPELELDALEAVAALGEPEHLRLVLDAALTTAENQPDRSARLLETLADATRRRKVRPAGDVVAAGRLLDSSHAPLQRAAIRLVGLWKVTEHAPRLSEIAADAKLSADVRLAAIEGLAHLGRADERAALIQLARTPPADGATDLRSAAVAALARFDLTAAISEAVRLLAEQPPLADPEPLFRGILEEKDGAEKLATALKESKIAEDIAKIGLRVVTGSGRQLPDLEAALRTAGGVTTGPKTLSAEELMQLVAAVREQGDPVRGEGIYRREDLSCTKCHAIGGSGGLVGPDLVSIGASAQVDYLIESLLVPNKAVKENYHT